MDDSSAIRVIHPRKFDKGTLQTPGSERLAAVAPQLGVESTLWGGLFEVEPGARTGFTIMASSKPSHTFCRAYPKSVGRERRIRNERGGRRFHFTCAKAFLLHMEIQSVRLRQPFRWVVVRSTSTPIVVNLPEDTWRSFSDVRNVAAG